MRALVVGGGSWGTAFARLLAIAGHASSSPAAIRDAGPATVRHGPPLPAGPFDVELPATLGAA